MSHESLLNAVCTEMTQLWAKIHRLYHVEHTSFLHRPSTVLHLKRRKHHHPGKHASSGISAWSCRIRIPSGVQPHTWQHAEKIHWYWYTSHTAHHLCLYTICFKTQWYRPGTQTSNPGTCCCKAWQTALLANSNAPDPVQVESNLNSEGSFFNLSRVPGTSSAFWTITSFKDKFEYSRMRNYHCPSDASQHKKCTKDSNKPLQTPTKTKAMIEIEMMAELRLQLIPRYREAQDCTWDANCLKHSLMSKRQDITSKAQCHFLRIKWSPHFVQSIRYS